MFSIWGVRSTGADVETLDAWSVSTRSVLRYSTCVALSLRHLVWERCSLLFMFLLSFLRRLSTTVFERVLATVFLKIESWEFCMDVCL